jgi:hypothetical protein
MFPPQRANSAIHNEEINLFLITSHIYIYIYIMNSLLQSVVATVVFRILYFLHSILKLRDYRKLTLNITLQSLP